MKYRIHFTDTAFSEAEDAFKWITERAPEAAVKWFNGLLAAVESLDEFPARCVLARETERTGEEIRQMLYGRKPHYYRILFVIRDDIVHVLHIRHGARYTMGRADIELPPPEN